jgi:HPt (histidine-containing phosphotransfer) domain-containing protein
MELFNKLAEVGVDIDATLKRFMGADALYTKFLKSFPENDNISSLNISVSELNRENIQFYAHALKGVSANLGITKMSVPLAELEKIAKYGEPTAIKDLYRTVAAEFGKVSEIIRKYQ